ncbi:hypothetical protein CERZMDRAFT_113099 [Cercospora zeae-maydis SCOH1-5]|uniref:Myotubularin phosphatase domain-containing protein n=1 Tax=Cercospora zeae-maydis SCOH1-5 TaxID=717836 RepID=A0A6A6FC30_9PEZI|nr:hypothetical protein CERZMDRAFT_113099 [Cercospora zeae-maydis SCOH1-5]
METIPRTKEIRERNVECYAGKDKIHGTVILQRHHLIFSAPESPSQQSSGHATPKDDGSSSAAATASNLHVPTKRKTKENWYPYPLFVSCVLRPTPNIRISTRDFRQMVFTFHGDGKTSADTAARRVFYCLRDRCCIDRVQDLHAFHFKAPHEELAAKLHSYDARREFARMGIGEKSSEGPGSAWRLTSINQDYTFSPTYPSVLCVPASVSDNLLKYGGPYRSKSRIPALTYLHSNGGSITRSSQPMPGLAGKRNPQDERLVSAIFSSHVFAERGLNEYQPQDALDQKDVDIPPSQPLEQGSSVTGEATGIEGVGPSETEPRPKIYGTTRKKMIVDARPKFNALANRATGGGIEDVSNYCGPSGDLPERIFLDIANIHVMRKSLAKVVESLGGAECSNLRISHESLQKSGWLAHIAGLLEGSEKVARAVGLGGDHVLLHCSDGWDRTSQVAAIAQVMLDPYYRTLAGFIALVQKDFLSFGHKFNHRHGILGCEKWFDIENERVIPPHAPENGTSEPTFGSKALSGARNWFEKNRSGLFRQQNESRSSIEDSGSRPPSPPANAVLHAPATLSTAKDREHKVKEDEIAPIFHQFLDAIFQLQHGYPNAFEFNEKFLVRLLYHCYACQYGEFLFNNERERAAQEHLFPSVWPHFLARRRDFINPSFSPKAEHALLFPRRSPGSRAVTVRWWSSVFKRKDEDMNTAQTSSLREDTSDANGLSTFYDKSADPATNGVAAGIPGSIGAMRDNIAATFASLQVGTNGQQSRDSVAKSPTRPALEQRETDTEVLAAYANAAHAGPSSREVKAGEPAPERMQTWLDATDFAQGSAYTDR